MSQQHSADRRYKIDLVFSRAPRAYRDEHNLWRDEIKRMHRLIRRHLDALAAWKQRTEQGGRQPESAHELLEDDRPHLSIAVFGPSGSGKSSLIRTLADDVRRPYGRKILSEKLKGKVATLPVMNPTTWAPSDQFLYAFLAAALEEERQKQEHKEHGYPQGLSPVQLAFQDVNEYLRVVDEPERSEEHDPLGLSLQKLERHTSGLRLRRALGVLIEKLAKELGSQVVLLPVDDLDMAPDHLVDALQSFQSFLMHPQLVPIFTFTDRMPEELIEVYYNQRLSEAASHQRLGGINRLSIAEQMAVQFLARCFPVRNRVRLGPAPARVQRALYSSSATSNGDGNEAEKTQVLELLIQASFLLFGYPDAEDAHKIRAALRPSTLRRQFQVVDAMSDCRLGRLRTPQFGEMTDLDEKSLHDIASVNNDDREAYPKLANAAGAQPSREKATELWGDWKKQPNDRRRLAACWSSKKMRLVDGRYEHGYYVFARNLKNLEIGATWATIFGGATWSLLNVHRDTLRELGLFLEDLYSWTPKELRSVVIENILAQDQETRRTVVDRWFNRTDYRRSQVLSLLAANIFRPWMKGEEPYGDEEIPIREQIKLEGKMLQGKCDQHPLDQAWPKDDRLEEEERLRQIKDRLTIPAPTGLLWFINVTLGFYLPQIMARNWNRALSSDESVRSRMSGNGWNLHHAAINAIRIADAKQEAYSFGMLFLDPMAYRRALEIPHKQTELALLSPQAKADRERWLKLFGSEHGVKEGELWRRHLLLRIWSCCGYSSGRYWAAFSLWRGLSFIGQVIEVGLRHAECFGKFSQASCREPCCDSAGSEEKAGSAKEGVDAARRSALEDDLFRLIRSHGLQGLVPGALLNRNANDDRLLHGFPKWEPRASDLQRAIKCLAKDLADWLAACWDDCIFPLPAGDIWIGWKDCFVRRIHGEYILGGLWPRLKSAYLEGYERKNEWIILARNRRISCWDQCEVWEASKEDVKPESEKYRWSASLAAGAWSDLLLEYWRGCPPILKLLLTCPVMFKSHYRFGELDSEVKPLKDCLSILEKRAPSSKELEEDQRLTWLHHLGLPAGVWGGLKNEHWVPNLVPSELAIPRVQAEQFMPPVVSHRALRFEPTRLEVAAVVPSDNGQKEEDRHVVRVCSGDPEKALRAKDACKKS